MRAAKRDLPIEQGSTFRYPFFWKTGKPLVPVNLAGCHARLEAYNPDGSLAFTLDDQANGGVTLTPAEGKFELLIPIETVATFEWDTLRYVFEVVLANGDTRRLMYGRLYLSREGV